MVVGVDLINELLRKSRGRGGLFKEGYLKLLNEIEIITRSGFSFVFFAKSSSTSIRD